MVDLPKAKAGIIACSGEEMPEGTVTRLAALKVLEELRPAETVTICLPLFLAGGEGDRAFARFYPTIAVDGCEIRCAARATEMYSGKPAASLVVTELIAEHGMEKPQGSRRLNAAGMAAVELAAGSISEYVDQALTMKWNRRSGNFSEADPSLVVAVLPQETAGATCSCGSGIPIRKISIDGQQVTLVALPLIFEQLHQADRQATESLERELLEAVKIYNPIPGDKEATYQKALLHEYESYLAEKELAR